MLEEVIAPDANAGRERAIAALRWAARVGTSDPDALADPPENPSREELLALDVGTVRQHLDELLMGKHTQEGLDALLACGALDAWLPEIKALVGFGDGEWRHKDVWKHTKQVVWQSVPRLNVRWGALLHDIGKVKTRRIEPNGQVHFFGHSEVGAAMFRKRTAQRLGFEGALYDRVHYLILHHLRASQYERSWTDSAVRRFARDMGDGLRDLLDLSRADITTKRPEKRKRGVRQVSELAQRIEKLQLEDSVVPPLPKGVGDLMMAHFGLPPSRRIGELKRQLEGLVEAGELEPHKDSEYYVQYMDERKADFEF